MAAREFVLVEGGDRHGHVLLFATGIGEAEINEFDFVVLHHLHHVCDGLGCHQVSPVWMVVDQYGLAIAGSVPRAGGERSPQNR
jgi:hypothetical protein